MKQLLSRQRLFWPAFLAVLLASSPLSAAKIALLVAVGDYPVNSGWPEIHSLNDLDLLRSALTAQAFPNDNIHELRDAAATREGILQAIQTRLLTAAKPGDLVFFHFSGHGQQVMDNNGDEADGYDEAIVPFDSPLLYEKGVNEGQFLIRDDELGNLFQQIRKKIGKTGQLIVVLDACHSGTGTRGLAVARGTDKKMADSTWIKSRASRAQSPELGQFDLKENAKIAPMTAFFGAAHNQLNYETQDQQGRPVGSLSYAFSKSFSRLSPNTTYRGLFEQVRLEMAIAAPRQTPQVEGALDRAVLGGDVVVQQSFSRVKEIRSEEQVVVEGGWLQGLNEGSVLGFYPPETRDPRASKPMLTGLIERSQPLRCTVRPDSGYTVTEALQTAWVFVLEQNPGDLRVRVNLRLPEGPFKSAFLHQLQSQPLIRLDDSEAADLILVQGAENIEILTSDELPVAAFPLSTKEQVLLRNVLQEIKNAGQVKFLRQLEAASSGLNLSLEIIPVVLNAQNAEIKRLNIASFTDAGGTLRLPEGTHIKLKITNKGTQAAYFTLLDIEPGTRFNILIPGERDPQQTPAEFRIPPGESWEIPTAFAIGAPYGQEIFKLIATESPVDLRSIKNANGALLRGPAMSNPLERLFSDSFFTERVQSRGGQPERPKTGSVGIATFNFMIVPAK